MSDLARVRGPQTWAATASYSQAVVVGDLVFLAGQYGSNDDGSVTSDSFEEQAARAYENIAAVLAQVGAGLEDIVSLRNYLVDPEDYPQLRGVRDGFIHEPFPTSTLLYVAGLAYPGMLIEIEAVARIPEANTTERSALA